MATSQPSPPASDLARLLATLTQRHSTLTLFTADPEDPLSDTTVTIVPREGPGRGRVRAYSRNGLLEALQAAAGVEPTKECPRCQSAGRPALKRLCDFPRDQGRPDGRFPYCNECNRENVGRRKRARRLRLAA